MKWNSWVCPERRRQPRKRELIPSRKWRKLEERENSFKRTTGNDTKMPKLR